MYRLTLTRGLVNGIMDWHGGGGSPEYAVGSRAVSMLGRSRSQATVEVDQREYDGLFRLVSEVRAEVARQRKVGIKGEAGPKDLKFAAALEKRLLEAHSRSKRGVGVRSGGRSANNRRAPVFTKEDVEAQFLAEVMPEIQRVYEADGVPDWPARSEAWNDFTDGLAKRGLITARQYESWMGPSFTKSRRRRTNVRRGPARRKAGRKANAGRWATGLRSVRPDVAVGKSAAKAFRALHSSGYGAVRPEYEHGHWWIVTGSGVIFDAVDATGPDTVDGWGFERLGG